MLCDVERIDTYHLKMQNILKFSQVTKDQTRVYDKIIDNVVLNQELT